MAVERGCAGRQLVERDAAPRTFGLEVGLELRSAIDLYGPDGEGHVGLELVEEVFGVVRAGASEGLGAGPLGERVAGGELLECAPVCAERDAERVELDDLAGPARPQALGQASGVGPLAADAMKRSHSAAPAAQGGHGHDPASGDQHRQDAACGALRDHPALAAQQDDQLGLAPHRIVPAHRLDRIHQRRRPVRPAQSLAPPRARLGTLRPAIKCGTRHADRLCGIGGTQS